MKKQTPFLQSGKAKAIRFFSCQKFITFIRSVSSRFFPPPCLLLTAILCWPFSLEASPGPAWHETTISKARANRIAEVTVPVGARRIAVEVANSKGEWVRWSTRTVSPKTRKISVRMPARVGATASRAWAEIPGSLKFPLAFYKNPQSPAPAASSGYGEPSGDLIVGMVAGETLLQSADATVVASNSSLDANKSTPDAKTEEADIWKADGTTVFFFNQLRGLQVIDLSDPADPALVCSLRLPAVGQDLYVLPESGGVRHAMLLARDPMDWDATVVHLVRISPGQAVLVASRKFSGVLAESRLKGNRLFLATQTWKNWDDARQDRTILREVLVDAAAGSLSDGTSFEITAAWPVVSAGNDWIAVATSNWRNWNISDVALFSISETGLSRWNADPIRTAGRIYDKFKMQVNNGVFSAFSQGWLNDQTGEFDFWGTRVTMLENFSVGGEKLAALEIVRNEWLFATRFAGDTAYAVTFEQVDPLWVIDLSNPVAPAITSHLEVPGWSTYIELVGDMLFSIGWDEGRVAASLFDVADPANPTLASRVFLSDVWAGFSESLENEKALRILPDQNLVLIPFSNFRSESGDTAHWVQILEINRVSKTLVPRGRIMHDFQPRRSAMVGNTLASISQRQLVTADITNPDDPTVMADILLAWPVQRVAAAGNHLYQIADGSTGWDIAPALRVSIASDPDTILAEIPIGAGRVLDAAVREGRLLLLRGEHLNRRWPSWSHHGTPGVGAAGDSTAPTLSLDVYDVSDPLLPVLEGTTAVELGGKSLNWETGRLLFPSQGYAVVLARESPVFSWWGPRILPHRRDVLAADAVIDILYYGPQDEEYRKRYSSVAVVFDFKSSDAKTVDFPAGLAVALDSASAAEGIVVVGCGDQIEDTRSPRAPRRHHAAILDLSAPGTPAWRKTIPLPGRLLAATEVDRRGFLAWTEVTDEQGSHSGLAVSACDLRRVFHIASLEDLGHLSPAIEGRRVFVANTDSIIGHRLSDNATFDSLGSAPMAWTPDSMHLNGGALFGISHARLVTLPVSSFPAGLREWICTTETPDLKSLVRLPDGSYASPSGDYGVEIFR